MSNLEKALTVSSLTRIIVDMQEKKERIQTLNHYDQEETPPVRPFFVEVGGGAAHIRYFPKNNDIGDKITSFFVELFDKIEADAEQKLSELIV